MPRHIAGEFDTTSSASVPGSQDPSTSMTGIVRGGVRGFVNRHRVGLKLRSDRGHGEQSDGVSRLLVTAKPVRQGSGMGVLERFTYGLTADSGYRTRGADIPVC